MQGAHIFGKFDTGYFMAAATVAEFDETCGYLHSRAVSGLRIESRLSQVSMPTLLGQLALSDNAPKDNANS